eukprot:516606_1
MQSQPTLTDADKLGLLVQCRMKMDKLNNSQLYQYGHYILSLLSPSQLKSLLFVGCNSIKKDIQYPQLFQMKSQINQIIEDTKKIKNKSAKAIKHNKYTIPIIHHNASLTKTIPFDIISNHICPFLKMSSITKLARCDRILAVICHTPTSIKNLMHRHDIYPYVTHEDILIDGHDDSMKKWTVSNMHRFKNVEKLCIWSFIVSEYRQPYNVQIFNLFDKVKHLSFYSTAWSELWDIPWKEINMMPLLQTVSFINARNHPLLLTHWLEKYKTNPRDGDYYNKIIYQLKSIAFVDCCFDFDASFSPEDEEFYQTYGNVIQFLLPSQPNNLEILKLENSTFVKTF